MEHLTVQGIDVPTIGFGTARITGDACTTAVRDALSLGYRHVDTAQMYDNERSVGEAIRSSSVARESVFVTTKIHPDNLRDDDVHASFAGSLDRLGLKWVDLLLIHAPRPTVPIEETIGAMNELQDDGLVRHVGVSNFSVGQLETAIDASRTPILTNQVEYHPYRSRNDLLSFCVDRDVMLTAYSPLARGAVVDDPELETIGERYGKTPAQVALRWLIQQRCICAIPKAARPAHRRENIDVFDFELDEDDVRRIFELDAGLTDRVRRLLGL